MQLLRFLLAAFVVIAVQAFAVSPEATEKSEKRAQDAEHNPATATLGVSSYCLTTNVQDTCVRIFRHATEACVTLCVPRRPLSSPLCGVALRIGRRRSLV